MKKAEKQSILEKAKEWFLETLAVNHIKNTQKLANPAEFNINPFLTPYLANFFEGNSTPESIAKALIYPRILGTSITTSFGTNIQKFSSEVLSSFGSAIPGIDLEFVDQIDGDKKYCQLKAGPNTINRDDVESIHGHLSAVLRLARTNHLKVSADDLIVGVLYGTHADLSGHYLRLEKDYFHPVFVGQKFWHRLTGDEAFYLDLVEAFEQVASTVDSVQVVKDTIKQLASSSVIQELSKSLNQTPD